MFAFDALRRGERLIFYSTVTRQAFRQRGQFAFRAIRLPHDVPVVQDSENFPAQRGDNVRMVRVVRWLKSVSICVQVVKTRINKGFLERVDGHCQRNCQSWGGWKHNSPQSATIPLKLAHYTLTCRDGSGA